MPLRVNGPAASGVDSSQSTVDSSLQLRGGVVLAAVATGLVLVAGCTTEPTQESLRTTSPPVVSSFEGPFIEGKALSVISSASWVEVELPDDMPLVERARLRDESGPVLINSTPESLSFVIPGGTCPPTVHVGVESEEPLQIRLKVDESVPPHGEECGDILKLHAFNLLLAEPVGDTGVDIIVLP